jgi:hypothetical protein
MAENRQAKVAHVHSHGNSVAAWTGVAIIMVGFLVMTIAVVARTFPMFIVGAALVPVGAIVGKVLSAMGFGISGRPGH